MKRDVRKDIKKEKGREGRDEGREREEWKHFMHFGWKNFRMLCPSLCPTLTSPHPTPLRAGVSFRDNRLIHQGGILHGDGL